MTQACHTCRCVLRCCVLTESSMKIHNLNTIICLEHIQKAGEEKRTKRSPSVFLARLCRQEARGVPVLLTGIVLTCVRASWCWETNAEGGRERGRSVWLRRDFFASRWLICDSDFMEATPTISLWSRLPALLERRLVVLKSAVAK